MPRPSKDTDKSQLNQLARELVLSLRLHSPSLTLAEIERRLDIGPPDVGSSGQTLGRWARAGEKGGRAPDLDRLQDVTEKARACGLLPAKRLGGIKRYDITMSGSGRAASDVLADQLRQAKDLEKARSAAVAALTAYASAIKGAGDWWVIADFIDHGEETIPDTEDMLGGVIKAAQPVSASPEGILGMAKDLERHFWTFEPKHP